MSAPGVAAGPLRILIVNWLDRQNPRAGGAEIHLHETFGRLATREHEVTLLTSGFEGSVPRETLDGIEVHRTGGRYTFGTAAPVYFRRMLGERAFDIVIEDLNKVPVFTPLWVPAPVVLLVHHLFGRAAFREASFPLAAATWLLERPLPLVFRGVPTVAVSDSTARDLERRGIAGDRIEVIPNGVDLDRYRPDPEVREFPEPTILYLGRLKRYKRIDLVLRAVSLLRDRGIACRLLVAGKGDGRPSLEVLRDELGLQDRVELLGWVSEARKVELLRRSWLHVLTSTREGWGISNLEAAACGTPTVASDVPGLRDSVRDGETGYLVPHENVDALAKRIHLLLDDGSLRETMGLAGRRFAERFSWDRSASRWESLLRSVAAAGSHAAGRRHGS